MTKLDVEVDGKPKDDAGDKETPKEEPKDDREFEYPDLDVPPEPEEDGRGPELDRDAALMDLLSQQQESNRLLQQRLDQLERRMTQQPAQRPARDREDFGDDDDDDGPVTNAQEASAVLLKEMRRMRAENQSLREQVKRDLEAATYGLRREFAQRELDDAVAKLNAKHGDGMFDDLDIVKIKRANPNMSIERAARAAEHKKVSSMQKAGYRRQQEVEKDDAPALPGRFDTASRPAFQPAKRATTVDELRRNTEEALRHSGFDELVAEANRVKEARLRQMEDMG
jgi:hypothetical protein